MNRATGPGGGVIRLMSGRYSIWAVALEVSWRSCPPKTTDEDRRDQSEVALTLTVTVAPAASGQVTGVARHVDVVGLDRDHRPDGLVLDPADHAVRRLVAGLAGVVELGRLGRLERALAGGVVQRDVGVEDATEVERRREEQQEDRQDEGELDEALAERPLAVMPAQSSGETGHR